MFHLPPSSTSIKKIKVILLTSSGFKFCVNLCTLENRLAVRNVPSIWIGLVTFIQLPLTSQVPSLWAILFALGIIFIPNEVGVLITVKGEGDSPRSGFVLEIEISFNRKHQDEFFRTVTAIIAGRANILIARLLRSHWVEKVFRRKSDIFGEFPRSKNGLLN